MNESVKSTYECKVCFAINSVTKIHCSCCGAVPAMFSPFGYAFRLDTGNQVIPAIGCDRTEKYRFSNLKLITAPKKF